MEKNNRSIGSIWNKWDLHIHTPASICQYYGGDSEVVWEKFISDLENLPDEFKAIGVNDYLFLDGYEKVLKYKESGRLKNINLILPVLEFRISEFAGVEFGDLKRPNIHVIFSDNNNLKPDIIRSQFLASLTAKFKLVSDGSQFQRTIDKESLVELGKQIIDSAPDKEKSKYGSPVIEGFNNLNLTFDQILESLKNDCFDGKYLLAIGKTEWDQLKWSNSSIGSKKTLINSCNLVFTAAESDESFKKAKSKLREQNVNDLLLDCSDAHNYSNSVDTDGALAKDRIGNCLTWIKADTTFEGLKQIIYEPENRVFVGDRPKVLERVENNKTKYIKTLKINQKPQYNETQGIWFKNIEINLNKELVAIIGNKGSGKSAVADIIGYLGNTKNAGNRNNNFSFLNSEKFRRPGFAENFVGELVWEDNLPPKKISLGDEIDTTQVERVKYLPQSYFEKLTNDIDGNGFEKSIRDVIFQNMYEADRLGFSTFDDLEKSKKRNVEIDIQKLKDELTIINTEIVNNEQRDHQEYRDKLKNTISEKEKELSEHEKTKPPKVYDPNKKSHKSVVLSSEQRQQSDRLAVLNIQYSTLVNEIDKYKKRLIVVKQNQEKLSTVNEEIERLQTSVKEHIAKYEVELTELGIDLKKIIKLKVDVNPITSKLTEINDEIKEINSALLTKIEIESDNNLSEVQKSELLEKSLPNRLSITNAKIVQIKNALSKPEKDYQEYKEKLRKWEEEKVAIEGHKDEPVVGTLNYYKNEQLYLDIKLNSVLEDLYQKRMAKTIEIFKKKEEIIDLYNMFKLPVDKQLSNCSDLPDKFKIAIIPSYNLDKDFPSKFLGYINKAKSGTFRGATDSIVTDLFDIDLKNVADIKSVLEKVIKYLKVDQSEGIDASNKHRYISDQISDCQGFYNYIFSLDYLIPIYELQLDGKGLDELSPGEKGALLLVFYLIIDKDDTPLLIDQPEDNLDNKSVFQILTHFIKTAKARRQIIIVTHNPNLAVGADAEQIIYVEIEKTKNHKFDFECGGIENPIINNRVVEILEGTMPAFEKRELKYIKTTGR